MVRFSYYRTANCTTPCGVVRCNAVMPFCRRFCYGLCDLVNNSSILLPSPNCSSKKTYERGKEGVHNV